LPQFDNLGRELPVNSGDKPFDFSLSGALYAMLFPVSGSDCGTVPAEKSEGIGKQAVKLARQGKPGVVLSQGRLKAKGRASAKRHGLSASPQYREVEPKGCSVPQVPSLGGSSPAKAGAAS
jgi:hypothetical protein